MCATGGAAPPSAQRPRAPVAAEVQKRPQMVAVNAHATGTACHAAQMLAGGLDDIAIGGLPNVRRARSFDN